MANILNLLFWGSPIIYSLEGLPSEWLRRLLSLNPMASFIEIYRGAAFNGRVADPTAWLVAVGTALFAWWVGAVLFSRLRDTVVEAV